MESLAKCPTCHMGVRQTDYFCFNCGGNLKPKPPSVTIAQQITLYIKCVLLPPFGLLWGFPYLRQNDTKSKVVGIVAIALTIVSFIITLILTKNFVTKISDEVYKQTNSFNY